MRLSAAKAMGALLAVPADRRTGAVQRAIDTGVEFLLSRNPAEADYPYSDKVSSTWFKLGFPSVTGAMCWRWWMSWRRRATGTIRGWRMGVEWVLRPAGRGGAGSWATR